MASVRRILAATAVLAVASVVRADMVPLSERDSGAQYASVVASDCPRQSPWDNPLLHGGSVVMDLTWSPTGLLVDVRAGVEQGGARQPACVLTDKTDSRDLFLYALLSLGLCKAAPWVKRLSLGTVPGWYREDGAYQVGRGLSISPEGAHFSWALHSIQPVDGTRSVALRCHQQSIVASWRKSQFVPAVVASRAPPARYPLPFRLSEKRR